MLLKKAWYVALLPDSSGDARGVSQSILEQTMEINITNVPSGYSLFEVKQSCLFVLCTGVKTVPGRTLP